MILNLLLFLYAIAKLCFLCGFAFSIPAMIFAEFRIVEVGIEQVRGEQLAKQQSGEHREDTDLSAGSLDWATSSPRNVRCA